jgi:hypothetical protein
MAHIETMSTTIKVLYKFIDGAHFFVSNEREVDGLCVASADLKTAFDEVANQLNVLFEHNYGRKSDFQPAVQFEVFKNAIEKSQLIAKDADQSGMMMAAMIQPWMYDFKDSAQ